MSEAEPGESWAIVELMGHVTMAGRLTEEERFGSKLGRLDIPADQGGFTTILFGGSSVYRITAVSEAVARAKARSHQPKPIYAYELPPSAEKPARESIEYHTYPDLGRYDPPDDEDDEEDEEILDL